MHSKLVINLDVLFVNDLFMSLILLWATARFSGLKVRLRPFLFSGVLGSLYTVLLVLPLFSALPSFLYIILHLLFNVGTAILMIRTAFGKMRRRKFMKTLGYFYLITFLAGGAALSIYFMVGSSPTQWIFGWFHPGKVQGWLYFAALVVTLLVGRYGWNIVRERFYREKYHITFEVWIEDHSVMITGLLDTGNQLRDPLSRLPVIIVEISAIQKLFPLEIQQIFQTQELDVIDLSEQLFTTSWARRFQLLPFSSVGREQGLMIGCKPDRIQLIGREDQKMGRVILGLHAGSLDLDGNYQALLHPEFLDAV